MGYRTYIASIPKREYNKIKSLTSVELFNFYKDSKDLGDYENDFYIGPYEFGQKLYEFGKYTDFDPPKKSMKPFFKKKELKDRYDDRDFYVVTKEFLEYIIESYRKRIKDYYNDMFMPLLGADGNNVPEFLKTVKTHYNYPNDTHEFDFSNITLEEQTSLFKIIEHVRSFRTEWTYLTPFNLNKGEDVTTSWKFEYGIFELVRIYKTFDWKRNVMIYYGY